MCRLLGVTRSLVYYEPKERVIDIEAENAVIEEFKSNRSVYGTRKLKQALTRRKNPIILSRRRIGSIMRKYDLVSKYTLKQKKRSTKEPVNEDSVSNIVNREFDREKPLEVVCSDLTYVQVGGKWHYICLLLDLANREIIGSAAGRNKDAQIVRKAFYRVDVDLRSIDYFHTDRGNEFKNEIIESILTAFGITRSLSAKGTPLDNAVMESMYNVLKIEMIYGEKFDTLEELDLALFEYVNWYNSIRLHGSLGYVPPKEAKLIK